MRDTSELVSIFKSQKEFIMKAFLVFILVSSCLAVLYGFAMSNQPVFGLVGLLVGGFSAVGFGFMLESEHNDSQVNW